MVYTIHCTFAPGAFANAKRLRLEHYAFLREVKHLIIEGGPLLGPDHMPTGMLMVIEAQSEQEARDFIAKEPYNASGFFESVAVRQWSHVIPESPAGFVEGEYLKELTARQEASAGAP